ncbi:MAG: hypothetical protein ACLR7D_17145 [Lachnospira eligens]
MNIERRYHPNAYGKWCCYSDIPIFYIRRNQTAYYFDKFLFDDFIIEMEERMGIKYTYNPMLILVEINKGIDGEKIEFQDKVVIELDDDSARGVTRVGSLFDKIFEVAKKEVGLDRFRDNVRMYYIKGPCSKNIINAVQGEWIESIEDVINNVKRFKIKR